MSKACLSREYQKRLCLGGLWENTSRKTKGKREVNVDLDAEEILRTKESGKTVKRLQWMKAEDRRGQVPIWAVAPLERDREGE